MILMGLVLHCNRSRGPGLERNCELMINMSGPGSGRFAFLDAGETARRLGIDRITLDQWVRDGRLKAYKGVGRESFFKAAEVDSLYKSLHPEAAMAKAIADHELDSAKPGATVQPMQYTLRKNQY